MVQYLEHFVVIHVMSFTSSRLIFPKSMAEVVSLLFGLLAFVWKNDTIIAIRKVAETAVQLYIYQ